MKIDTSAAVQAAINCPEWVNAHTFDDGVEAAIEAALPHLARAFREALLDLRSEEIETAFSHVPALLGKGGAEDKAYIAGYYAALTAAADHVFGPPKADEEKK